MSNSWDTCDQFTGEGDYRQCVEDFSRIARVSISFVKKFENDIFSLEKENYQFAKQISVR
jgi:hypothetical protein